MWLTRVCVIPLSNPHLREESFFPSLPEPRMRSERALLAVVQTAYVEGVSTRKVDDVLEALGPAGIDKSKVSRLCRDLDELVEAFRNRKLEGEFPNPCRSLSLRPSGRRQKHGWLLLKMLAAGVRRLRFV